MIEVWVKYADVDEPRHVVTVEDEDGYTARAGARLAAIRELSHIDRPVENIEFRASA